MFTDMSKTLQDLKSQNLYSDAVDKTFADYGDALPSGSTNFAVQAKPRGVIDYLRGISGFYTKADEFNDQLKLRQLEHQQQLETLEYENAYNSPVAEVARLRAAGINPDLQGLSGVQGAAEYSEPEAGLSVPQSNDPTLLDVGLSALNLAGVAQSLVQAGISLKNQRVQLDSERLSNLQKLVEVANSVFNSNVGPDVEDDSSFFSGEGRLQSFFDMIVPKVFGKGKSGKRIRSAFNAALSSRSQSFEGQKGKYANRSELEKSRKELSEVVSSPYYSDDDKQLVENLKPLTDLQYQVTLRNLELNQKIAEWKKKYQDVLDPELAAGAQNAQAETELSKGQYLQNYYENLDGGLAALSENARNRYSYDYNKALKGNMSAAAQNARNELMAITDQDAKMMSAIKHQMLKYAYERAQSGNLFSVLVFSALTTQLQAQHLGASMLGSVSSLAGSIQ